MAATSAGLPRLEDADVGGRRVLLRADLNVPLSNGAVTDDYRIRALLPTLEYLIERGARVVACSHLGRPRGPDDDRYRMAPVAEAMSRLLGREVTYVPYVTGPHAKAGATLVGPGEVTLLENLRFEPGETANDPALAEQLASLADVYVNDAFGASHRAHASIVGVPRHLPSYAGFLLAEEVRILSRLLQDPPRPFVVVLGGAKVSDKLGIVRHMHDKAERILIGGGMCFTFLKARGHEVGRSLVDEEHLNEVRQLLEDDAESAKIVLPVDVLVASSTEADVGELVTTREIPSDAMGLDIGPATAEVFSKELRQAGSVLWNGPMGVFENNAFAGGSRMVTIAVATCDGYTVAGGGDTVAALTRFGMADEVDFISTGGGASLEFLEGRTLPGIAALVEAAARS